MTGERSLRERLFRVTTVNYRKRDASPAARRLRGIWFHRGVFARGVPMLALRCRLFGHRGVVDGTTLTPAHNPDHQPARWVVCDRCGERPEPQGRLDPGWWQIGDRYNGVHQPLLRAGREARWPDGRHPPGTWPARLRGEVGGEFVLSGYRPWTGFGWEFKVGNGGSEHTIALNLHAGFASVYLHTTGIGTWLVRRLNPVDLESKLIGLRLVGGRVEWKLWAPRDNIKGRPVPRWQDGALSLRWRDKLLGPRWYRYTDVPGAEVARVVRMPEAEYLVQLKLQRVEFGRARGRKKVLPPHVAWSALGGGIPTKAPLRGRIFGSGVEVPALSACAGTWPAEAVAAIVTQITASRTRHGWEPTGSVPVDAGAVA